MGYEDADALVRCLCEGFKLVGEVPVAPDAPECLARDFESTTQHVDEAAVALARKFVQLQSKPPSDEQNADVRKEIFRQTVEDQRAPARIGPFRAPSVAGRRTAPPTRRFGVRQASSSGKIKIRCIDDFSASLVNGLVRINRRIRMGSPTCLLARLFCPGKLAGR